MIEAKVINYITETMALPCYAEEPEEKPAEYVVIRLIELAQNDHIDNATIDLVCIAESMADASALCYAVREAMLHFDAVDGVSRSACVGGGQDVDTRTRSYRYSTIFSITFFEED